MKVFRLYGIYSDATEAWVRETGERIINEVNNPDVRVTDLYFPLGHQLCTLHGWKRVPLFSAVKHNQPFRKIEGKYHWETYDEWMRGLGWKI